MERVRRVQPTCYRGTLTGKKGWNLQNYKQSTKRLKIKLYNLGGFFDAPAKSAELEKSEKVISEPGFWDDQEKGEMRRR